MRPDVNVERNRQLQKCFLAGFPLVQIARLFKISLARAHELAHEYCTSEDILLRRANIKKLKAEFYDLKFTQLPF